MSSNFFSSRASQLDLSKLVLSNVPDQRWSALIELGGIDEQWAIDLMRACLSDPDERVKRAAHLGLGLEYRKQKLSKNVTPHPVESSFDFSAIFLAKLCEKTCLDDETTSYAELHLRNVAKKQDNPLSNFFVPFPQADNFERVLEFMNVLASQSMTVSELAQNFGIDDRQVHYYLSAARYLDLLEYGTQNRFVPNESVRFILNEALIRPVSAFIEIAERLLRVGPVAAVFLKCETGIDRLGLEVALGELRLSSEGQGLGEATLKRRARTVQSWALWVRRNLDLLQAIESQHGEEQQIPLPNCERALATIFRLQGRETSCLERKNAFFSSPHHEVTLSVLAQKFSVSRERIRQIESEIVERLLGDVDRETLWDWRKDLREFCVTKVPFDSLSLISVISRSPEGESLANILLEEIGLYRLPNSTRYWASSPEQVDTAIKELQAQTPQQYQQWHQVLESRGLSSRFALKELGLFSLENGLVVEKKRRRVQIVDWYLRHNGSTSELILARECGEAPSRAFGAALRRDGSFTKDRLSGEWELTSSAERDTRTRFSSTFEAVIKILTLYGPLSMSDLQHQVRLVHKVSESRISQALDDERVGRLPDGRVALIEQGGARFSPKPPPAKPIGLWEDNAGVHFSKKVTDDIKRGSGFGVPSWLLWRFNLSATPDSISFQSGDLDAGQMLLVTRRGGQAFASSIRETLAQRSIHLGCTVVFTLVDTTKCWSISHNHLKC